MQINSPLDLLLNELRSAVVQVLAADPGAPVNGQVWVNSTTWTLKVRLNGITVPLGRLDQITAPTADVDLNNHKLTGLADGVNVGDAVTMRQLLGAQAGMDFRHDPVRAASTGNVNTAAPGAAIDAVNLAAADRVLLKDQAAPAQNGIWVWNGAAAAMTRAADADASAELGPGMFVIVTEGATNADTAWILTTDAPVVLGTTSLTFAKFPTGPGYRQVAQTIDGDGATTVFNVDHLLGTTDVLVQVRDNSDGSQVLVDNTTPTVNRVTLTFGVAPAATKHYRVIVGGKAP